MLDPWHSVQPRGKHYLNNMVKAMFSEAKISGGSTNHSLRATGVTELFQSEVPEKVIQGITGHRSISRHYVSTKELVIYKRRLLVIYSLVHLHKITLRKLKR